MNEQYIIDRILKDAKVEADAKISSAKKTAAATLKTAKEEIELANETEFITAKNAAEREAELGDLTAKTEEIKNILVAKHKILDDVFTAVRSELVNMNANDRKNLIDSLIKRYKKSGDQVTEQNGGIIISNNTYELRLTLDDLLNELRNEIEPEVVKILFGGQ